MILAAILNISVGICLLTVSAMFGQLPAANLAKKAKNNIFSKNKLVLARTFKIDRLKSKVVVSGVPFSQFRPNSTILKKRIRPTLPKMAFLFLNMSLYGLEVLNGRL